MDSEGGSDGLFPRTWGAQARREQGWPARRKRKAEGGLGKCSWTRQKEVGGLWSGEEGLGGRVRDEGLGLTSVEGETRKHFLDVLSPQNPRSACLGP